MNAIQMSLATLEEIIKAESEFGDSQQIVTYAKELRERFITIAKEQNPKMETYLNRTEHVEGGLSVTCVCNFTTHFTPDEVGAFVLEMACPNCNRIFWQGKPAAYRGITDDRKE